MNPREHNDPTQPTPQGKATPPDQPSPGKGLQDRPQDHPDQTGAGYGGYGHADNSFGRDAGSSSEEGGQGGEPGADSLSVPKTLRGGSDGGAQTRHASSGSVNPDDSTAVKQPD